MRTFGRRRSLFCDAGALVVEVEVVAARQIPLVEHERGRAARLHRQLGDPQVLRGDARARVAHDQRDVGALRRPLRAQRRVVLDGLLDLGLAADAGGVDEHQPAAVDLQLGVDRVAGGPGHLGDDHPLAAQEGVHERGLADVRAADDREAHEVLLLGLDLLVGREQLHEPVQQVAGAEALGGRDGHRVAEPEPVEVVGEREVARRVDLVRHEHDGHVAPAQEVGDLLVARPHAGARVDDEHRHLRVGQRGARLVLDRDGERVLVVEVHAAGVDQRERAPVPVGLELLAVARDPRPLVHDRLARLGEAVDQRRLAHVGVADDGDLHASISLASTTSVKIISSTASRSSCVVSTGTASLAAMSGEWARRSSRSSRSSCAASVAA